MTAIRIKLETKKIKSPTWMNGLYWRFEFSTWSFYQCDIWMPETEEMYADYCEWTGNTRKEYKQHLKEYHANV